MTRRAPTEKEPERLVIEAGCDSLELVCAGYAKTVSTLRRQLAETSRSDSGMEETTKEHSSNGLGIVVIALFIGVATGIVITLLTRRIWQKVY